MRRAEVWLVRLVPTEGSEISKIRPAVIVNDDGVGILPLKVIVPITTWKNLFQESEWLVRLDPTPENGLRNISAADTFQVRSVAQTRLIDRLGKLSDSEMRSISHALKIVLSL